MSLLQHGRYLLVVGLLTFGAWGSKRMLVRGTSSPLDHAPDTLPSLASARYLALGYAQLAADYYWLRTISHYGNVKRWGPHRYPLAAPLLERALTLDPYFRHGYEFAGTALTQNGMSAERALELTTPGVTRIPGSWQIPFYAGFIAFYHLNNPEKAAVFMATAAKRPGAPPQTAPLATRLAAEAGRPELGIALLNTLIPELRDEKTRTAYQTHRRYLQLEIELRSLQAQLKAASLQLGRKITHFDALVAAGLLPSLPHDPFGSPYSISSSGEVRSATPPRRLDPRYTRPEGDAP